MKVTAPQQQASSEAAAPVNSKAAPNPLRHIDEHERGNPLQLKAATTNPLAAQANTVNPLGQVAAPAPARKNDTGLPDQLKTGIEGLSGFSMDDVKVHYNSAKPAQLQALAYAQGTDIHIGPGQEQHLPHEAWHVVQQKQGRVQPTVQMKGGVGVNDDKGLEREADVKGWQALAIRNTGRMSDSINPTPNYLAAIQRMPAPVQLERGSDTGSNDTQQNVDPAHQYWKNLGQDNWDPRRIARETKYGMQGYIKSWFVQPSRNPTAAVLSNPARLNWHNKIIEAMDNGKIPKYLGEQWLSQNNSQANGNNPLPKTAGEIMLEGAEQMSRSKNAFEVFKGYKHAQLNSLGGDGFQGGASKVMHSLALPVQLPNLFGRAVLFGPESAMKSTNRPVLNTTRMIGTLWQSASEKASALFK